MALASPTRRFAPLFPVWIRAFVRAREIGLVFAAICIGAIAGLAVAAMGAASQSLHRLLFALPADERLSQAIRISPVRVVLAPALGGLLLSGLTAWVGSRLRGRMSDAIEANALYGGRMSVASSLYLAIQTVISSGFGASVGLEAGFTQIGAGFASWVGRGLAARRNDMRLLVACGAAGAIAAAFGAPLTGSFYAFELVLGAYSVGALAPVVASAVVANYVDGIITQHSYLIESGRLAAIDAFGFVHVAAISLLCAGGAVAAMQGVAHCERWFARSSLSSWEKPIVGGLLVGGIGLIAPQVLGAGHGALQLNLSADAGLGAIGALIVLKIAASSISLGSGFRGGLFFASLLLGSLVGRFYAEAVSTLTPYAFDPETAAIAGMAAFGAGVLGAPIAMIVLALESTGDFSVTLAAVVACSLTTLIVRETFGYSFATWRFHLRGETIRGPLDVGWSRDMKVGRLMLKDVKTMPGEASIGAARSMFPPGSVRQFAVLDGDGRYAGVVSTSDLYAVSPEEASNPVKSLVRELDVWLLPDQTIKEALDQFERSESDALAVLDGAEARRVIGVLTEAHALRRYGEELERRNNEIVYT